MARAIHDSTSGAPGTLSRVQQAAPELETAANAAGGQERRQHRHFGADPEPDVSVERLALARRTRRAGIRRAMFVVLCLGVLHARRRDMYKRKAGSPGAAAFGQEADRADSRRHRPADRTLLLGRAAISVVVGLCVWIAFRLMGLQDPGVWGVISAVLFTIPFVGPTIIVAAAADCRVRAFGSLRHSRSAGRRRLCNRDRRGRGGTS